MEEEVYDIKKAIYRKSTNNCQNYSTLEKTLELQKNIHVINRW